MQLPDAAEVTARALAGDWSGVAEQFGTSLGTENLGLDEQMRSMLEEALERRRRAVKAFFFGYDPLNQCTAVYLCESYGRADEDWNSDFEVWVDGPTGPVVGSEDDELRAAGELFASFGRAVSALKERLPVPVSFGFDDGDVYDAVRPARVRAPKRSRIPRRIDPDAIYRLAPVDPQARAGSVTGDSFELHRAFWTFRWRYADGEQRLRAELERFPEGLPTSRRPPEHVEKIGVEHVLSRTLADVLSEQGNRTSRVAVVLVDPDGVQHPYDAWRPDRGVPDVNLEPSVREGLARGRVMPAFRRRDVAGVRVFTELVETAGVVFFCFVSGEVLQEIVRRGCVSGLEATPVIVLEPGEAEQPGDVRSS